ncbi:FixH family protein [Ferruginibacter sp.]
MNWGYKILFVYGIFIAGILFMVFKSSTQKMDLVTTDYYAKELKYQEKIDEANRVSALSEEIRYQVKDKEIAIYFPKDFLGKKITGIVNLYCPSDAQKDITQNFLLLDEALTIPTSNKGQFELHINCQANGITYYFEKKIFID